MARSAAEQKAAEKAVRDLQGQDAFQALVVQEVEGSSPIRVEVRGGLSVLVGASWKQKTKGGKYTPIGASFATQVATAHEYEDTEMELAWDAAFMRPAHLKTENLDVKFTPEGLAEAFETLRLRARTCNVTLAGFARTGLLRAVELSPNRGYAVDPLFGGAGSPGVNIGCKLTWEWAGIGIAGAPAALASGDDVAGQLQSMENGLANVLSDDPFAPGLGEALGDGLGKIRAMNTSLRKTLKGVGDLARAPAKLANDAIATARALGNTLHDLDNIIADARDDYAAAGAGAAALLRGRRGKGEAQKALGDGFAAVAALLDAFERRKPRSVGVRPGQSLVEIAKRELGSGDRWAELAEKNEIAGQVVPAGMFVVDLPSG